MRFPICPHPCEHLLALFKKRFIYLFRTILGLRCCKLAFSSNIEWGLLLTTAHGLLFGWFILLRSMDAMACGIFPDQGSNLCPTALAGRFLTTGPPGKPLGLFDYSHPSKCGVVSHCGFDLHFPDGWWCRVSFTYLFSSVAQSCLTLCDPMDCSLPGFSVCHQLPELAQTHVHQAGDAVQPSHPL